MIYNLTIEGEVQGRKIKEARYQPNLIPHFENVPPQVPCTHSNIANEKVNEGFLKLQHA
jgi:hypothetical protein